MVDADLCFGCRANGTGNYQLSKSTESHWRWIMNISLPSLFDRMWTSKTFPIHPSSWLEQQFQLTCLWRYVWVVTNICDCRTDLPTRSGATQIFHAARSINNIFRSPLLLVSFFSYKTNRRLRAKLGFDPKCEHVWVLLKKHTNMRKLYQSKT